MATLRHRATGTLHPLSARVLVGRSGGAGMRLAQAHVSGEHATLSWGDEGWSVRDLGSRNGTFLGENRLPVGAWTALARGAVLAFGDLDDPWDLVDDAPPGALAEHVPSGILRIARDGFLALPDDEVPEHVVFVDARGRYVAETPEGDVRPLVDGAVLATRTGDWRVRVPAVEERTREMPDRPSLDAVRLRFRVSRDEEHVAVSILYPGHEIVLEEREHLYLLLTLARVRLQDADAPPSEQGWVDRDRLLRMLAVDTNALNVAIFRARQQVQAAGVEGAASLVEVRRGQRRIGVARLEVVQE